MRPGVVSSALLIGLSLATAADAEVRSKPPASKRPLWGGFGYGSVGFSVGRFANLENELRRPDALGEHFSLSTAAAWLGGGGKALIWGRFLVGGKGHALLVPTSCSPVAKTSFVGGGGGLELGYVVYNAKRYLVYPYVGLSGYGVSLSIENWGAGASNIRLGSQTVLPGRTAQIDTGFAVAEFGAGMQRMFLFGSSGILVGAEAGFLTTFFRASEWTNLFGIGVHGLSSTGLSGAFLRLTFGGGGFLLD
jgi:hypothetical protein